MYGPDEGLFLRHHDGTLTDADRATLMLDRHALHAWKLKLVHPMTGEPLELEAPLAPDMWKFLESM
jgi:23S rRNA pseudouridine1911/1915/1917 synthase